MGSLNKEVFVCIDCEATGLDTKNDKIIEIAAIKFTFDGVIEEIDSLINPMCEIPLESQKIHNINDSMVQNKPLIKDVLHTVIKMMKGHIIIGHGINFDLSIIYNEARRSYNEVFDINSIRYIDTLRLARLYGESPCNSLDSLKNHFNIKLEGKHRAKDDVLTTIALFKHLSTSFKTTEQIFTKLQKPIVFKTMPLGKYKGRKFNEIPSEYLYWVAKKDFDADLSYSIRSEIKIRKQKSSFSNNSNPFLNIDRS